jgi:hypothetical protein
MSNIEIESGDSGYKLTVRINAEERRTEYKYHYFTKWDDVEAWLRNRMAPKPLNTTPTEKEKYRAAKRDIAVPPPSTYP